MLFFALTKLETAFMNFTIVQIQINNQNKMKNKIKLKWTMNK